MGQLFRRRTNFIASISLIGVIVLIGGTGAYAIAIKWSRWETQVGVPLEQPVPFSHQHHVSGLGIDCRYCHTSVTLSRFAGMPPMHTCMTCHSQIWQDSPMLAPVRESFAKSQPLQWNRVHRLPKYVYFDHSIHVNKGIGCTSCHGEIGRMPLLAKARTFYMRDCLACHRQPENFIRRKEEVFDVDWVAPENQREIGAKLVRQYHIPKQRLTDCYTCHR